MKKALALLLSLIFALSLAGCASQSTPATNPPAAETTVAPAAAPVEEPTVEPLPEPTAEEAVKPETLPATLPENLASAEIQVFAAASLTEAFTQIAENYKAVSPNTTVVFNFDSSGKLQTQIEEGAEADVFVSAALKQMDALDQGGYILEGTREDLLVNSVVLITAKGSDTQVTSFEDVATDLAPLVALGNADVPVGQYAEEIFGNLGIWDAVSAKASFGGNVKEVLSQVESASVDVGVVYSTDAATSDGVDVICAAPEGSHSPVVYPAAVIKESQNSDAGLAFIKYLRDPASIAVFEGIGFKVSE
ncbi:MAG: molybdate ABC transporter substrate-binding protein [Clostridiales bacterium]|jgi:molybdate transport system substrate-binding protein|nr:molybdate ABC transporter substrate-binding protein [Clostridiales bacterium]